jgi:hypothetical protein
MNRKVTAVVLCEDKQSQTLLVRYLKERGFARVRSLPLPAGQGCGSQYVRERYATEVRRQRDGSVAQVLVVHLDADKVAVEDRHRELADELKQAKLLPRDPDEPIALVVPRWETETWLHHYLGRHDVVETQRYPKFKQNEANAAKPTVAALIEIVDGRAVAPTNIPAIALSAGELRRLP